MVPFVSLLLVLWLSMAVMTHLWLVPKKQPHDYGLFPRWYGARAVLLHGENPYSAEVSTNILAEMGYPPDEKYQYNQRFYYPATVVWILLPLWLLPFSVSIVIWCGLQLLMLFTVPLLVFQLLRWHIKPLAFALVAIFSTVPWRHSANAYALGQYVIFTLACLIFAWAAVVSDRPWLAALALIGSTIRSDGMLLAAGFLLDLLLAKHYKILIIWVGMMAVVFGLSVVSTGFWIPDFLKSVRDYSQHRPTSFPPAILGNDVLAAVVAVGIVGWGLWLLVDMRSLPDHYRMPWTLAVLCLMSLLVPVQSKDYTLVYALLPIWLIIWAGRDQPLMFPLMLLILTSPWIYAGLKANMGHGNPVEQFSTPLVLLILITYQWRRQSQRKALEWPRVTAYSSSP